MSSNSSLELTSLDFNEHKAELINFLKSQDRFKDINFQGSNINALLDVLAYNSYQNAFYLNMVASEMFLDSAQLRSSVVSHAKELNYTPRSFRSARAVIDMDVVVDPSITDFYVPKKTTFTTVVGDNTFTFSTASSYTATPVEGQAGVFTVNGVEIFEGTYLTESFVVNTAVPNQKFVLSSPTVDTTSIVVRSVEDSGESVFDYSVVTSLFGLETNSRVCFLEATENGKYQLTFGDSAFVRKPPNNSVLVVEYRVCSGELPNGASEFTLDSALDGDPDVNIVTSSDASGGAVTETNDEIKFNAPRFFQTQERAVTSGDYVVLMKQEFPEIRAINAYGGEDAEPPQFGKVIISVDLQDADGVTEVKKNQYTSWIKSRMPLSIDPVFINPDFIYVQVTSSVKYDLDETELTARDIQAAVQNSIIEYSDTFLDDFNKTLRYSRLVDAIDNTNASIISNNTELKAFKLYQPTLNVPTSFTISFFNRVSSVVTSRFGFRGLNCYIADDGNGVLQIINSSGNAVVASNIGSIDYTSGRIQVDNITIESFVAPALRFEVDLTDKDIIGQKNNIVTIRGIDVSVSVVGERQ